MQPTLWMHQSRRQRNQITTTEHRKKNTLQNYIDHNPARLSGLKMMNSLRKVAGWGGRIRVRRQGFGMKVKHFARKPTHYRGFNRIYTDGGDETRTDQV